MGITSSFAAGGIDPPPKLPSLKPKGKEDGCNVCPGGFGTDYFKLLQQLENKRTLSSNASKDKASAEATAPPAAAAAAAAVSEASTASKDGGSDGAAGVGAVEEYKADPPSGDEIGRCGWTTLHTFAAYYPERADPKVEKSMKNMLNSFAVLHPCEMCGTHMLKYIEENPPVATGQHEISQWLCRFHNAVNAQNGKPQFDCSTVNQRWRDGFQ
eukprot:TRINITY_DN2885_c1_g1_i3.p1 TRINITY_DN2885_c1_g1~~TRINITY_DN2885_c1_g1_i3.p1  ORF type:complete len:213 (-),score=56.31 TRINITY_DN2885_c1_g1_i3:367-1005(-)